MTLFTQGYALVVAVRSYPNMGSRAMLPQSVLNDAVDIARLLWNPDYCAYPADQLRLLLDEQATVDNVRKGLQWLADRTDEEDTVVFYFSGHGLPAKGDCDNRIACYDASLVEPRVGTLLAAELSQLLDQVAADRLAVILDCCYAGSMTRIKGDHHESPRFGFHDEDLSQLIGSGKGRALLASSGPTRSSMASSNTRNSPFTHFLLEALTGAAAREGSGIVDLFDIFRYVRRRLQELQPAQVPFLHAAINDPFPIARVALTHQQTSDKKESHKDKTAGNDTTFKQKFVINRVGTLQASQNKSS